MKRLMMAAMVISATAFAQSTAQETAPQASVSSRAQSAQTAEQHLAVASEYRQQAVNQEEKVREYSLEVQKLNKRAPDAVSAKWRHATPDSLTAAQARLLEAKRALREAKDAAQHHSQVALELRLKSTGTAQGESCEPATKVQASAETNPSGG